MADSLTILGPLTTIFSAPFTCNAVITSFSYTDVPDNPSVTFTGLGYGHIFSCDPRCYPPIATGNAESVLGSTWGYNAYSPGICPQQWSSWPVATLSIGDGTFAALCCPTGMTNSHGWTCLSTLPLTVTNVWAATPGWIPATGLPSDYSLATYTYAVGAPSVVQEDGFYVLWESTDTQILSLLSQQTASSVTTTTARGGLGSTAAPGSSVGSGTGAAVTATVTESIGVEAASGLSTGSEVGIGVGAVVCVAFLIGLAIFFVRRNRRRKIMKRLAVASRYGAEEQNTEMELYPELSNAGERYELLNEGWRPELEVTPQLLSVHRAPMELADTSQRLRVSDR